MSPIGKLFAAALIVATGFGVATLLGEPSALTQALHFDRATVQPAQVAISPSQAATMESFASRNVQLVPETTAANNAVRESESVSKQTPLVSLPAASSAIGNSRGGLQIANSAPVGESTAWTNYSSLAPRAKLRNEAPRPVGSEPRSPATIRRTPPGGMERIEDRAAVSPVVEADPYVVAPNWPAPQLLPAGYTDESRSTAATQASYDELVRPVDGGQIAPPPWPATEEAEGPRTHIIVDGDSLERLAGRYLSDPHRSAEIYELNRGVLTNPDLLPIGAELKIPERTSQASWDRQGRRMGQANDATVREAAYGNLVPLRPISPYQGIVPRAQLARPLPVE